MTKTEFIEFYKNEVAPYVYLDLEEVLEALNRFPDTYDFSELTLMFKRSLEKIKLCELGVLEASEAFLC